MEEQLISFETAKLVKEKGCELPLYGKDWSYVDEEGDTHICNYEPIEEENRIRVIECTQSLLHKWLREEHGVHIDVVANCETQYFDFKIVLMRKDMDVWNWSIATSGFDTYEDALEKGLQEALKLIIL